MSQDWVKKSLPQVRWHSQTSLEVPTRHSIRSPRGQQDARIPRDADLGRLRRLGRYLLGTQKNLES